MKKYRIKINGIQPLIWNVLKREIELEKKSEEIEAKNY